MDNASPPKVWVVVYTFDEYEGPSAQFIGVAASKEGAITLLKRNALLQHAIHENQLCEDSCGSEFSYQLHCWDLIHTNVAP